MVAESEVYVVKFCGDHIIPWMHIFVFLEQKTKTVDKVLMLKFQGNDLQGVKAYFNLDPKGLFTLGTVVVDYRGYRITAQSIIPGE